MVRERRVERVAFLIASGELSCVEVSGVDEARSSSKSWVSSSLRAC